MTSIIIILLLIALIFVILFREEIRIGLGVGVVLAIIGILIYFFYSSLSGLYEKFTSFANESPIVAIMFVVSVIVIPWGIIREFLRSRRKRRESLGLLPNSGTDRAEDSVPPQP